MPTSTKNLLVMDADAQGRLESPFLDIHPPGTRVFPITFSAFVVVSELSGETKIKCSYRQHD